MTERMIENGLERRYHETGSPEFDEVAAQVVAVFPQAQPTKWWAATDPYFNSTYGDTTVSILFRSEPAYVQWLDERPGLISRKFFMTTGYIYDKMYYWVNAAGCDLAYPQGASPIAIAHTRQIYGQSGSQDFSASRDLYFVCPDHAAVEAWAGESLPQGQVSTHYGVTYTNGERARVKAYCYDSADSAFEAWDVYWLNWANAYQLEH